MLFNILRNMNTTQNAEESTLQSVIVMFLRMIRTKKINWLLEHENKVKRVGGKIHWTEQTENTWNVSSVIVGSARYQISTYWPARQPGPQINILNISHLYLPISPPEMFSYRNKDKKYRIDACVEIRKIII